MFRCVLVRSSFPGRPVITLSGRSLSSNSRWQELASVYATKAKQTASDAASIISQRSRGYASRLYESTKGSMRNATVAARQKMVDKLTLRQSRERLRSSLDASQQKLRDSVAQTKSHVAHTVLASVRPAWNSFFWWSLAAIGVYGIASTVPKEIVRSILVEDSSTKQTPTDEGDKKM